MPDDTAPVNDTDEAEDELDDEMPEGPERPDGGPGMDPQGGGDLGSGPGGGQG